MASGRPSSRSVSTQRQVEVGVEVHDRAGCGAPVGGRQIDRRRRRPRRGPTSGRAADRSSSLGRDVRSTGSRRRAPGRRLRSVTPGRARGREQRGIPVVRAGDQRRHDDDEPDPPSARSRVIEVIDSRPMRNSMSVSFDCRALQQTRPSKGGRGAERVAGRSPSSARNARRVQHFDHDVPRIRRIPRDAIRVREGSVAFEYHTNTGTWTSVHGQIAGFTQHQPHTPTRGRPTR